jgi:hypothetical protein
MKNIGALIFLMAGDAEQDGCARQTQLPAISQ